MLIKTYKEVKMKTEYVFSKLKVIKIFLKTRSSFLRTPLWIFKSRIWIWM